MPKLIRVVAKIIAYAIFAVRAVRMIAAHLEAQRTQGRTYDAEPA